MTNLDAYIEQEEARLRAIQALLAGKVKPVEKPASKQTHRIVPDGLSLLEQDKRKVFGQMNRLHALLAHVKTTGERKTLASRIVELDEQLRDLWRQIDHLTKTGKPMAVEKTTTKAQRGAPDFEHDSESQLVKKRNNARSYVSKAAKKGYAEQKVQLRKEWIEAIDKHLAE